MGGGVDRGSRYEALGLKAHTLNPTTCQSGAHSKQ